MSYENEQKYKQKYLKYKQKYLNLSRTISGGGVPTITITPDDSDTEVPIDLEEKRQNAKKKYLNFVNITKSIKSEIAKAQQNALNLNIFIFDESAKLDKLKNQSYIQQSIVNSQGISQQISQLENLIHHKQDEFFKENGKIAELEKKLLEAIENEAVGLKELREVAMEFNKEILSNKQYPTQ